MPNLFRIFPIDEWKTEYTRLRRFLTRQCESFPHRVEAAFLGISGVILASAVAVSSFTLCYTVDAQGQPLSYFQDAETYQAAVTQAEARASKILQTNYSFNQDVTVRSTLAPKNRLESTGQVADSIMGIIPELKPAYTLWVDGEMVGAVLEEGDISRALSLVKERYTTPETQSITVESQLQMRYAYVPADTVILTAQALADCLLEESPRLFPYEVRAGDTLEQLLSRFDMTQERLQDLNPDIDLSAKVTAMGIELSGQTGSEASGETDLTDLIAIWAAEFGTALDPGLQLTIEQSCPRLVVSTVEERTLTRPVAPTLQTRPDNSMFAGEQRVIQEGEAGETAVLARVVKRCGVTVAGADLNTITTAEALPLIVGVGTQPMPELPDGCLFLWPVRGTITSDYGYRFIFGETNFHRGIDIAAPADTAISAGADGVVTFCGEKGTYGNLVVISHGNGFQTYYAHCSKILVSQGDTVSQGQPVAAVGSTGRSTGPHVHFEVRYNNTPIDPLLYLPGENNAPARTELDEIPGEDVPQPETPTAPAEPGTSPQPETPAIPETPAVPVPDQPEDAAPPENTETEPSDPGENTGPN
ncbi:MAG: peptidoglycan DD-metalloendopeptidase family protein [Ruminiclostridium sp.]|nr:peptidoglycan DD-metalloendopeptidase family protein [Ruminiclostridium sp.]